MKRCRDEDEGVAVFGNQWRHLTTDEAIQAALDWLEDEDWLCGEPSGGTGPGSGRRTVRYRINPAVTARRQEGGT